MCLHVWVSIVLSALLAFTAHAAATGCSYTEPQATRSHPVVVVGFTSSSASTAGISSRAGLEAALSEASDVSRLQFVPAWLDDHFSDAASANNTRRLVCELGAFVVAASPSSPHCEHLRHNRGDMARHLWYALPVYAGLIAAVALVSLLMPARSSSPSPSLAPRTALPQLPPPPPAPPASPASSTEAAVADWKDPWMAQWVARHPNPTASTGTCQGTRCTGPQYVPQREKPPAAQAIPRVIWHTWESTRMGPVQHRLMRNAVEHNRDYEYVLFTDADCWEFVCRFGDARTRRAFELVRPGAAKADIWRLLVVYRYGGVYLDSDCVVHRALDTEVWPNASVVVSVGIDGYTPQWLLAYSPRHPIIRRAIEMTVDNVLAAHEARQYMTVSFLTGPGIYHFKAVLPLVSANGCVLHRTHATLHPGMQLVYPGSFCHNTTQLGVIQYVTEAINGAVSFKDWGIGPEKQSNGHKYHTSFKTFDDLFTTDMDVCSTLSTQSEENREK
eukprot:m51a1_g2831 hypothetical protein (501) ;mRNA; r:224206-230578